MRSVRRAELLWPIVAVVAATLSGRLAQPARAAAGTVPVQGVVRDHTGTPVAEGAFRMTFRLYEGAEAETALWSESHPPDESVDCSASPEACVAVRDGVFTARLGSTAEDGEGGPTLAEVVRSHESLWLGVSVEGEPELPRRPLDSAGRALVASDLDCSGCVTAEQITDAFRPSPWTVSEDDDLHRLEGRVGIGTAEPASRLDVAGTATVNDLVLRAADGSLPCNASNDGRLRYRSGILEVCTEGNWRKLAFRSPAGSEKSLPGESCRQILEDHPQSTDGDYWIDPNGGSTDDAFLVTCEMDEHDGGWTKLHLHPDPEEQGLFFADDNTCSDYSDGEINDWGFGSIIDVSPKPSNHNCYAIPTASGGQTHVWELTYYDANGHAIDATQIAALSSRVTKTVYDGDHYHWDIDSPCSVDGVGPYGQPDDTTHDDGGGGYVLFPSTSSDPSTGSDFVLCDNDNPHNSQAGSTEHEVIDWEVVANGLMTHIGVQDRGDGESDDVVWGTSNGNGGGRGVLGNTWVWVR